MKGLFFIISLLCPLGLYAQQNFSKEFNTVTPYEMSMKEYDKDKDAEALVVYDSGIYRFVTDEQKGFLLSIERTVKIKILKSSGLKYAQFEMPYSSSNDYFESLTGIEGNTYNLENGQIQKTPLTNKNIFDETPMKNVSVKKIAFPNVHEGSVIELKYDFISPDLFNIREWKFQNDIPVVFSQLTLYTIPYYSYSYILKGTNQFDENKNQADTEEKHFGSLVYREMKNVFTMKDLPAYRDEDFVSSDKNYRIALSLQLSQINYPNGGSKKILSTWPQLCDDLLKEMNFGKYIVASEKISKDIVKSLNIEEKTSLEKVKIISQYLKSTYAWNEIESKFASMKADEFIRQKVGNSADLNLFLIGMLKAAGIDAEPLGISTRTNGAISKLYPFLKFINYVIAMVDIEGSSYFIDATEPLSPFDELPPRCSNVEGLVIQAKQKTERWVVASQNVFDNINKMMNLNIDPDHHMINVSAMFVMNGNHACVYRHIYNNDPLSLTKNLKKEYNIDVKGKVNVKKEANLENPFIFRFSFDLPLEGNGNKLFISPFCNLSFKENWFKQNDRKFPIDLIYAESFGFQSNLTIPEGYKIEYIPKDMIMKNDMLTIAYSSKQEGNQIVISAAFVLNDAIYMADRYEALKNSFSNMIKQFSDIIVLVKN